MRRVGHKPSAQYPCLSRGKMAMQGMNPVKNTQPWVKLYGASREDQGKRIPHTLYLKMTAKSSSTGKQTCKKRVTKVHIQGAKNWEGISERVWTLQDMQTDGRRKYITLYLQWNTARTFNLFLTMFTPHTVAIIKRYHIRVSQEPITSF